MTCLMMVKLVRRLTSAGQRSGTESIVQCLNRSVTSLPKKEKSQYFFPLFFLFLHKEEKKKLTEVGDLNDEEPSTTSF